METVSVSKELELALNSVEKLLNDNDGEFILELIRKFKQDKNLDFYTLQELRHRLCKIHS